MRARVLVYACVWKPLFMCILTYVYACMRVRMRACVCLWVRGCLYVRVRSVVVVMGGGGCMKLTDRRHNHIGR